MNELAPFLEAAGKLTVVGLLMAVIWALFTGRLRLAREVERERERADKAEAAAEKWMSLHLRTLELAKSMGSAVAAQSTTPNPPPGN